MLVVRSSVVVTVFAAVFAAVVGCEGTAPAEGEGEAGEGEGDVVVGEGEGEVPTGCDVTGCDAGQECGSIFIGDENTACYANCSDGAVPCTTAAGNVGECRNIDAFDAPVCRSQAENLGPCGNAENAGCLDDDAVCAALRDADLFPDGASTCVRACDVDADCGADLGCSLDVQIVIGGDPAPHGICAPLTAVGSPCGRRGDGSLAFCTTETSCDRQDGESQGACQ